MRTNNLPLCQLSHNYFPRLNLTSSPISSLDSPAARRWLASSATAPPSPSWTCPTSWWPNPSSRPSLRSRGRRWSTIASLENSASSRDSSRSLPGWPSTPRMTSSSPTPTTTGSRYFNQAYLGSTTSSHVWSEHGWNWIVFNHYLATKKLSSNELFKSFSPMEKAFHFISVFKPTKYGK